VSSAPWLAAVCSARTVYQIRTNNHKGLQDQLNDLGREGWELTAVTDVGDAKIFILKQPDIVDPLALASVALTKLLRVEFLDPRRAL